MSTHPSIPGFPHSSITLCYRSAGEPGHLHPEPYRTCQACRRTICPDCIAARTATGGVICVECYQNQHSLASWTTAGRSSAARGAHDQASEHRGTISILFWHVSGETVLVAIGSLLCTVVVLLLGAMLYGEINDIPRGRVTVAIVAAVVCWILVAIQIQRWVRNDFGEMLARVAAFLIAFVVAILSGLALMNWTFLDKVL